MAAPRAARPLLWPAQRPKMTPRRCWYPHTALRNKSSSAGEDGESDAAEDGSGAGASSPRPLVEHDGTPLGRQLADLDIPPEEYKELWRSKQAITQKMTDWEPRTREEAQQRWKQMQTTPDHLTLLHTYKQAGLLPAQLAERRDLSLPGTTKPSPDPETEAALQQLRSPINVRAVDLRPLRRAPEYGVPVCDLQLRSFSIRNLLLFSDFAVRAAYYMALPARGPVPLPRITQRWTVPKANFVNKKSQENFERITMRRLIQIQDGHTDVVKAWLAFLLKHQYHGVAMKANIWEYESLEAATRAGHKLEDGDYSRRRDGPVLQKVEEILGRKVFKEAWKDSESKVELRR